MCTGITIKDPIYSTLVFLSSFYFFIIIIIIIIILLFALLFPFLLRPILFFGSQRRPWPQGGHAQEDCCKITRGRYAGISVFRMEGYLVKRAMKSGRNWKKRYFILDPRRGPSNISRNRATPISVVY